MTNYVALTDLLAEVRACNHCESELPLGPRPVLRARASARILIVGQAPGTRVHETGIPWNDPSGERLRQWMQVGEDEFYDENRVAIIPMGFCYPGKGKSGDLPPRKECAQLWHRPLLKFLPDIQLTLLVGSYSQRHYLPGDYKSLTERVKDWRQFAPQCIPLVHPSPRNRRWLRNNPWFERETIPYLRTRVREVLAGNS